MVFEGLINPIKAEKKPWEMIIYGILYSSFAILVSLFIFREDSSLVMIFLTTLAAIPIVYSAIRIEEKKDMLYAKETNILKEHGKALSFFMFMFIGFVISFFLWNTFIPQNDASVLFETQLRDIQRIELSSYAIQGNAINIVGTLGHILWNNLRVLFFSLAFSFIYGFGAIFILSWNASVIGTVIGNFVRGSSAGAFLTTLSIGFLRYMVHGIPEILAYFTAGLAGGILSIAIARHDFRDKRFGKILKDSLDLVLLSIALLFIAAIVEVFISPMITF